MTERPRNYHMHSTASEEVEQQAKRAKKILERLAAAIAATDTSEPPDDRDIVRPVHVRRAAEQLFGAESAPLQPPTSDVFVSYAAADSGFARRFVDRLRANQLRCFYSAESIQPAALWTESIWQGLRECKVVVFLATPAALKSHWCTLEIGAALAMKKQIIPALRGIRPKELPDFLRRFQAVTVKTIEQRDKLIQFLKTLCSE